MNRVIRFGVYFLTVLVLFSIFTAMIDGGNQIPDDDPSRSGSNEMIPATTPPTDKSNQYYEQEFIDRLNNSDITVLSINTNGDIVTVKYVPGKPNKSVVVNEIGTIAFQYASLVRGGWEVSKLKAQVIPPSDKKTDNSSSSANRSSQSLSTSNGSISPAKSNSVNRKAKKNKSAENTPNRSREPVATWYVKTEWVKNMEGKNSSEKLLQKILNSIEL